MSARLALALLAAAALGAASAASAQAIPNPVRTLDGSGNNVANPTWGQAGSNYVRVAGSNYADGIGKVQPGPDERYLSNRIFNDIGQNVFSEDEVSQWGWVWGQFMDHDFGLRDETATEHAPLAFNASDPLESFTNDFGAIDFFRTNPSPDTGVRNRPRAHVNTLSSYIDGSNVFGITGSRLDWLRDGSADGNPANNEATLMLPDGYLPKATARGDVAAAPPMDLMGPLTGQSAKAVVAGDVRANENIALTATHTLFAR